MYFYIEIRKNDLINPFCSLSRPRFGVGTYSMLTAVDAYDLLAKETHPLLVQLPLNNFSCTWEICFALFYFRAEKNKSTFLFADVSLQMYFIGKKKS